jgi:exopolysaccharide production protein ExoZ
MAGAQTVEAPRGGEYSGVQALRGLAACFVAVFHTTQAWSQHVNGAQSAWVNGRYGVEIFFVISGFVMVMSTDGKAAMRNPGWRFMERRLVRIVPLYWLVTAMVMAKALVLERLPSLQHVGPHARITIPWVTSSLLFVPFSNSLGTVQPVVMQGWTLSFEMLFYVLFATALALRLRPVRWLTVCFLVMSLASFWVPDTAPAAFTLVSPLLLEFVAGMLIAQWVRAGRPMPQPIAVAVAALSLLTLLFFPTQRIAHDGAVGPIASALLVWSVAALEPALRHRIPRLALSTGNASYSLYLTHLLTFSFLLGPAMRLHLMVAQHGILRETAMVVMYLIVAILVGLAVYQWVEAPINNRMRDWLGLRQARRQPSVL